MAAGQCGQIVCRGVETCFEELHATSPQEFWISNKDVPTCHNVRATNTCSLGPLSGVESGVTTNSLLHTKQKQFCVAVIHKERGRDEACS